MYSTGNADYAGRSVFTGYRTETTLKFTETENKPYSITEQINNDALDSITYVNSGYLNDLNEVNYNSGSYNLTGSAEQNTDIAEQNITEQQIYRIRLSYDNVDQTTPTIKLYDSTYAAANPDSEVKDRYTTGWSTLTPEVVSQTAAPSPYQKMADYDAANEAAIQGGGTATDCAILIPETGELLISKSVYEKMMKLTDDVTTPTIDESQIQITYEKSTWKKDDLRPEHYFACTDMSDADPANHINYNTDYLSGIVEKKAIEYDVGLNQAIRINTTADEVFTHAIGRDVDDLIASMQEVVDMTDTVSRLEKIKEGLDVSDPNYSIITNQIDAANKALTFLKEKNQALFEGSITKMQKHLNKVNEATTECGTREKKLDLIKNRLMSQKTNFETLASDNENVDLTDVAIELKGAELTYQAALMSTSKILQTSLMNYI